jgi:hypothetical protein
MNIQIPNGFEFQRVYCYPNPDQPLSYYYLSLQIQPQRDTDGNPIINLVSVGTGGFLQLSVSWNAPSELLNSLRQTIAQHENVENPDVLRLAFAPVTVQHVALLLGDGEDHWEAIATSKSSGFPPYTALFNAQLNAERQTQVAAALNGRENFLQIEYCASLSGFVEASAKLTGDASNIMTQFKGTRRILDQQEVQRVLEQVISEGQLQITVNASQNASNRLIEQVKTHVLIQSAELLLQFLQGEERIPDITHLDITVTNTEPQQLSLNLTTDVATWFTQGSGLDQIQLASGVVPSPSPAPTLSPVPSFTLPVRLNFPSADVPIELIMLQQGARKITLTPPDFSAERPEFRQDESVDVETSYSFGGVYAKKLTLSGSKELALSPADLGLAQVTVDATALEEMGAKKVRIWLRYRPDGDGVANETTIYLRDRPWQATWFVISRSDTLQGFLEYEWQVTLENGDFIKREMTETTSPHIVLTAN